MIEKEPKFEIQKIDFINFHFLLLYRIGDVIVQCNNVDMTGVDFQTAYETIFTPLELHMVCLCLYINNI